MLEADNEFRQTAGLPQLDLPEHLWTAHSAGKTVSIATTGQVAFRSTA